MPIQEDILDALGSQLGEHLAPMLAKLVQDEVDRRLPKESRPAVAAPKKKKRGRPPLPRAFLGGKEVKLDLDPAVRGAMIRTLEMVAKRDNLTLEIL